MSASDVKAKAARYLKLVEWSDEDGCFIGRIPGLTAGGVHGDDEARVYQELCDVAEEWVETLEREGKPLPEPTAGRTYSGKFIVRVPPEIHQLASLKAAARNLSLNQYVAETLTAACQPPAPDATRVEQRIHEILAQPDSDKAVAAFRRALLALRSTAESETCNVKPET